ncbi:putative sterigmatocystin biosynthesis peroxidase stcC [Daldinia childiae]|uniref:putative sterigmatocystin biosynthesis peroxidase stcC n=1 Tax=Daldinia childiae TaxID=326645 RepID=UPI001444E027|nr:putative sterigmatocystin biosynthesis peroxidase stcC [Daldinia childiae]KAF3065774.1 putative sterigmatocystin biosynthesis peroxidase stcC [Daldinia childiae]
MKLVYLSSAVAFGSAIADTAPWEGPGPSDVRGPCPMLNSLANHGFLPHDGKSINVNKTVDALSSALNLAPELASFLHSFAVTTNPQPNATTFDLDHLSRHNILEHDGSLSRQDSFFGPADVFNEAVFNQTKSYWTGDVITIQMAANARVARLMTSNLTNPEYTLSHLGSDFSIGESVAYLSILGSKETGEVPKAYVEYLFENERLPYELGFSKMKEPMTESDLEGLMDKLVASQHFPQSPGTISKRTEKSSEKRAEKRCPFH